MMSSLNAQKLDRSQPPKAGPAPKIQLGDIESFELDNGLKVFVVENHKLPRVAFSLQFDIDPNLEGDSKGYAAMAGSLLGTATKNRSKDEIDQAVDFIGATMSASDGGIYGMALTKHQDKLLELMSDVIINPVFKEEELEKLKTQEMSALASAKDEPETIANNVRAALTYGPKHPYGEVKTEETVEKITLDQCKKYCDTYFKPNISYLAVVGDITSAEAKPLIEKYFGKWAKGEVPTAKFDLPKKPEEQTVAFVHKPGAVQSVIHITYPVDLKPGSEDAIKASMMNTILGRSSTSRLFMNLREDKGYTYGSYSQLKEDESAGYFTAFANVRNEVTDSSITEILHELNRLRTEKVAEEELQGIKNFLTGVFAIRLENPQTIARYAIDMEKYGMPKDYYSTYLEKVAAVTTDDIQAMAKKYITPENAYVLVVGNKDEVAEKLKPFGKEMIQLDTYGKVVEEGGAEMALPEGLTADQVITNYVEAIGGAKNMEKVKSIVMKATTEQQGMTINLDFYQKNSDKFCMEVTGNGMLFQKQVYDGKAGLSSGMQGSKAITGDDLEKLKYQSIIHPELQYEDLGFELELKGMEKIGDKNTYAVAVTSPIGEKTMNYFDTETGFKVQSITTQDSPMGAMTITIKYDDYKEIEGVKYPFSMDQNMGPQNMKLKVASIEVNTEIADDKFSTEE